MKTEIVGTENPRSGNDLKTYLKQALKDDRMVLLELGNKEKQWTDTLKNCEKKIVMIDCKTLQNDQVNYIYSIIQLIVCTNIKIITRLSLQNTVLHVICGKHLHDHTSH